VTQVLYFARFRQIIGKGSEDVDIPAEVETVSHLLDFLARRDTGCAAAFSDRKIVKAAINRQNVSLDATLVGATEIAFFPPVTGG
jgi:molybdopterin synthase sulfur carrier subunit